MDTTSIRIGTDDESRSTLRWRDGLLPTALGWVAARVLVAIGFVVAGQTVDLLDNPGGRSMIREGLFVWDGAYYRALGELWYGGANPDAARFFPLYPQLARILAPVFGGNVDIALVVIANVSAFAGALVVWMLTSEMLTRRTTHPDPLTVRATADRSAWMVAIFPAGFVFAYAYTESLALLLTAATLLALLRRQLVVAGLLALAAAMLRPVGGLLLVPIAIEFWQTKPRRVTPSVVAALAAPVLGLVGAFVWIYASTKDFLLPLRLQQEIRGGFQDPITRMLEPIGEIAKGNFRDVYNFGFMVVFSFLGYQAIRARQPLSWIGFMVVSWLILMSSQVTDSLGRYGLVVVPFIIAGAQWADTRWKQVTYASLASIGMIWLVSEAMIGRMVP